MAAGPDFRTAMKYATAGIEFVVAFGLGAAGGVYLDRWAGGGTLWPLAGAALGFAVGMGNMVRMAKQFRRDAGGKDRQ